MAGQKKRQTDTPPPSEPPPPGSSPEVPPEDPPQVSPEAPPEDAPEASPQAPPNGGVISTPISEPPKVTPGSSSAAARPSVTPGPSSHTPVSVCGQVQDQNSLLIFDNNGQPVTQCVPISQKTEPPTPTQTPPPNPVGPTKKAGVSGGAVAGVAIGCLIAGAALAALILILLSRRRRSRQPAAYAQHHIPHSGGGTGLEKGPTIVTTTVTSNVDSLLPQPVADDAITSELSKIRDNIKNHVNTYYHFNAIGAADIQQSQLTGLASATGMSTSRLASLLLDPSKRGDTIRLFLAWFVISRCQGTTLPSLLSTELAQLNAAVSRDDEGNTAQCALYSKWKVITGVLLHQQYGKKPQSQNIEEAIAAANAVLAPFVLGSLEGGQRRRNLEMILSRAANFAFLLFSQPGSFHFDFRGEVVFPGVLQLIGDDGHILNPPRSLWEKEYGQNGHDQPSWTPS